MFQIPETAIKVRDGLWMDDTAEPGRAYFWYICKLPLGEAAKNVFVIGTNDPLLAEAVVADFIARERLGLAADLMRSELVNNEEGM